MEVNSAEESATDQSSDKNISDTSKQEDKGENSEDSSFSCTSVDYSRVISNSFTSKCNYDNTGILKYYQTRFNPGITNPVKYLSRYSHDTNELEKHEYISNLFIVNAGPFCPIDILVEPSCLLSPLAGLSIGSLPTSSTTTTVHYTHWTGKKIPSENDERSRRLSPVKSCDNSKTLCHDNNAFLASLFHKIDLNRDDPKDEIHPSNLNENSRPRQVGTNIMKELDSLDRIIEETCEKHSIALNSGKLFPETGSNDTYSHDRKNFCVRIDELRRTVYRKPLHTTPPKCLQQRRSACAPYRAPHLSSSFSTPGCSIIGHRRHSEPPILNNSRPDNIATRFQRLGLSRQNLRLTENNLKELKKNLCEGRFLDAVSVNNVSRVEFYLKMNKCSASVSDEKGRSALHIASAHGFLNIVEILLSSGADPNALDSIGNRPLDLALSGKHTEIAARLILAGTNPSANMEEAVSSLTRIARDLLHEIKTSTDFTQIHLNRVIQTVCVVRYCMNTYKIDCQEMTEIVSVLEKRMQNPDPINPLEELAESLNKSLYFSQ